MQRTRLMPTGLNRVLAPERLSEQQARVLRHCDVSTRPGKLQRARGAAGTQITGATVTIFSAGVFARRDGKKIVVDRGTGGTVRITPGDGTVDGSGPLPEWNDSADAET